MDAVDESRKPVVGYEGLYEVSNHGRVRGLDRTLHRKDGRPQTWKGGLLKPAITKRGYLRVGLRKDGKKKMKFVHRLVLEAFTGPCPDDMQTRHLNGDPADNRFVNLRYGTASENRIDTVRHGRHHFANRDYCPRGHKLIPENVPEYRKREGHRNCLACGRAYSYIRNCRPDLHDQFRQVADKYYEKIMEEK